jgi:hypothetical protein
MSVKNECIKKIFSNFEWREGGEGGGGGKPIDIEGVK